MPKKLLIVDDEQRYREKYSALASEVDPDLEIILAENVEQGIERALAERPDAIVTDKDMPDGTGNDLARAVRAVYQVPIAGVTGGYSGEFKEELFDIRVQKTIEDAEYKTIVQCLLTADDPRKEYAQHSGQHTDFTQEEEDQLMGMSIILQGYNLARKLQKGEKIEGIDPKELQLKIPSEEKTRALLDVETCDIDPQQFYARHRQLFQAAGEDVDRFFADLAEKRFDRITDEQAEQAEKLLYKVLVLE
jgi:DNA-binding response OmpR family regulator